MWIRFCKNYPHVIVDKLESTRKLKWKNLWFNIKKPGVRGGSRAAKPRYIWPPENIVSRKKVLAWSKICKFQATCAKLFWIKFDSFDWIFYLFRRKFGYPRQEFQQFCLTIHLIKAILIMKKNSQKVAILILIINKLF